MRVEQPLRAHMQVKSLYVMRIRIRKPAYSKISAHKAPPRICNRQHFQILYFSLKQGLIFHVNCLLDQQRIHMKFQALFP